VATLNTLIHGLSTASPRPSAPALLRLFRFLPEAYAFAPESRRHHDHDQGVLCE
jgi:hypothetical protein